MNRQEALKASIKAILMRADHFVWTVQGFGMIRTYLGDDKRWRLNVWDDRLRVPNVSDIHTHPWDFQSVIIGGVLKNQRFLQRFGEPTHEMVEIVTGEEGGLACQGEPCMLWKYPLDYYVSGMVYKQHKEEIHVTEFDRGTVTLNDRSPPTASHKAKVFFPLGTEWVDAKPRLATKEEVENAVEAALALL